MVACLILFLCFVSVFLACQSGVSSEFFWNQVLFVLEDLFKFLWVLDGIDKTVLGQPVASLGASLSHLVLKIWACKFL